MGREIHVEAINGEGHHPSLSDGEIGWGVKSRFDLETARCVKKKKMNLFGITVMMAEGEGKLQTGARPCWGAGGRRGQSLDVCWEIIKSSLRCLQCV